VVVQHRQWVAAAPAGEAEVALEVHLPEVVGAGALEAAAVARPAGAGALQQPVAAQDGGDGAGGRDVGVPLGHEAGAELAPAPGGVLGAPRFTAGELTGMW
jgi:hypothetical protein